MDRTQSQFAERENARSPYRAPTVSVVLHHSETHSLGGTGFDGSGKALQNRS
jgi:hypothetical protein